MKRPILIFICLIGLVWPGCEKNPTHSDNNSYKQKQIDCPSLAELDEVYIKSIMKRYLTSPQKNME